MSFDEIQNIWNSQEPLPGRIDEQALRSWIQGKNRSFSRIVSMTEVFMTLVLLFVGVMFMKDPILQGHDLILIIPGIASWGAAIFVWTGRIARKKRELHYEESLLGIVSKSIGSIDYHTKRMKGFLWWFAVPNCIGLLIGLVIVDPAKRYLFYFVFIPAFALCMALTYWQIRREIRLQLSPERQRLAELQASLTNE